VTSGGPPLLEAVDVVAGYLPGVDILRGCGLRLQPGELVGVIGPNGAGKSTLVKACFGLVPVRSGTVRLAGEDVTNARPHDLVRRGVGYVPQRRNVFGRLSVADNLRMGSYLHPERAEARIDEVLEVFPALRRRLGDRAVALSGGQRQMLAMARALVADPRVLLLDEPSAGLSPRTQDEVFERIDAAHRVGTSIVMVEQNARRCLEIADRAYVLDQGLTAYEGRGRALLDDPRVVELYLGSLGAR
jgi:branched-chain amino acid transport system ATP-binding protein